MKLNFDKQINEFLLKNNIPDLFENQAPTWSQEEFDELCDLDLEDWQNILARNLLTPDFYYAYDYFLQKKHRVKTLYLLSKLENEHWNNIFKRNLFILTGFKVFNALDLVYLSKLNDEEFDYADSLGIFDYDNELMEKLSCKAVYILAKYPPEILKKVTENRKFDFIKDNRFDFEGIVSKEALKKANADFLSLNSLEKEDFKASRIFLPCSTFLSGGFGVFEAKNLLKTKNLLFFAHSVENEAALKDFLLLNKEKPETIISSSYINFKKGNYKLFFNQGVILEVNQENIYAGYFRDMYKLIKSDAYTLLHKYLFNPNNKIFRNYFPDLLKSAFNFATNQEYIEFYDKYKNIPIEKIEDSRLKEKIEKYLDSMKVKFYEKSHNHNEILVSHAKIIGFYSIRRENEKIPDFIINSAKKLNLPILVM